MYFTVSPSFKPFEAILIPFINAIKGSIAGKVVLNTINNFFNSSLTLMVCLTTHSYLEFSILQVGCKITSIYKITMIFTYQYKMILIINDFFGISTPVFEGIFMYSDNITRRKWSRLPLTVFVS